MPEVHQANESCPLVSRLPCAWSSARHVPPDAHRGGTWERGRASHAGRQGWDTSHSAHALIL